MGAFKLTARSMAGAQFDLALHPDALPGPRALVGKEFFLHCAIARGFRGGRADVSIWRVAGADLAVRAKVRVVAVEEGGMLRVKKA